MNSFIRMGLLLSVTTLTRGAAIQTQPLIRQLTETVFDHKTIGLINVHVYPPNLEVGKIEITSNSIPIGQVFFQPACSVANAELIALFKKVTGSPTLDGYACIHGLHIVREYRNKKLCPLIFFMLKQELIRHGYTGVCLIADPYNVDPGKKFESDQAIYTQQLEKLLLMYKSLGIEPRKDTMGNLMTVQSPVNPPQKSIVCIQCNIANITINRAHLEIQQPITPTTRLERFWNCYRMPISLGISGAVLVAAVLGWHSIKNRTTQTR